jgi:hypothetical protein
MIMSLQIEWATHQEVLMAIDTGRDIPVAAQPWR